VIARILIAAAMSLSVLTPTEVLAKKYRIEVRYATGKNPCAVVAGVKRMNKIKTTAKSVQYNTSKPGAVIVHYFAKAKPTCALIYPR